MMKGKEEKYRWTFGSSILATERMMVLEVFLIRVSGWL